jgi:cbb3-type cytochrome oxidase subunit 3
MRRGARIRGTIRWILLLLTLAFVGYDWPQTWHNYSKWRLALPSDSVAAGFWRTAFYSDVREIAIALAAGIVIWIALRPRAKRGRAVESRPAE